MTGAGESSQSEYFRTAYRDYDAQNPTAKLDHYLDVIEHRASRSPTALLDVGCGRGLFLARAADRFPECALSGVDIDEDGVAATRREVPAATIRLGHADEIPFPDASFDVVTAWDVLEHVPNLPGSMSELTRCVRPGGVVALVVPVYDGLTAPLIRLFDRDPTHVHKDSRRFWVDLASEHFQDIEWHGIHRFLVSRSLYLHRPSRRMRAFTAAILISAIRN